MLALSSSLFFAGACSHAKTRAQVMHELSSAVSSDDLAALSQATGRLVTSSKLLIQNQSAAAFAQIRLHFREALLAWERASCFPNAALTQSHAQLRAMFWPIRPGAVQNLVVATGALDQASVSDWGVDRKGLFALEFLLFGPPGRSQTPLVESGGDVGARARVLSLALAENVASCAASAAQLEPQGQADPNTLLTRLLSHMSTTLGSISSGRLSKALAVDGEVRPSEVKGYASGTSLSILEELVTGTERVYLGSSSAGLTTLVAQAAPDCDRHLRERFRQASAALAHARASSSSPKDALTKVRAKVRALDVAVETELAQALGITLLFQGNDAD